jgi:hypothetical protein
LCIHAAAPSRKELLACLGGREMAQALDARNTANKHKDPTNKYMALCPFSGE